MSESFLIEEFDGVTADEPDVRARWVADTALSKETHPHFPPKSFDA